MKLYFIDNGKEFDFGRVSSEYAAYRNIYPKSMYDKLISFGIGKKGQSILDLGSGTAVLPLNLSFTGADITASDISENQINAGRQAAEEKGLDNIKFKVCSAEYTGFEDNSFDAVTAVQCFHYFNADKAAEEISRILKPNGVFCKILMDWLPFEDNAIGEMEELVLKYNPNWGGGGFRKYRYNYPDWAEGRFDINTIHSYNETLEFTKEAWLGRVLTCRGVGASLNDEQLKAFIQEYSGMLDKYGDIMHLKHQIHIEIYSARKG